MPPHAKPDRLPSPHPSRPRRSGDLDLELFHVRDGWDHAAFRDHIERSAARLPGVNRQADIARVLDVTPSLLSKWFRGQEQPSLASLVKVRDGFIANGVQADLNDLLRLTGRLPHNGDDTTAPGPAPAPAHLHPIAREINTMLAEDSPMPVDKRDELERFLTQVVKTYRPEMRRRRLA